MIYETLVLVFGILSTTTTVVMGDELPRYTIKRAARGWWIDPVGRWREGIVVDGKLDEPDWASAEGVGDFVFPWYVSGEEEQTVARLLWDDTYLYVSYYCYDKHISAYITERHGSVSRDDCVEIFVSPSPNKVKNYYTFEVNCVGTMLNRAKTDWWTGGPTWDPEGVLIGHSVPGPTKDESPDDRFWIVELAIPLINFQQDAAHTPPTPGDEWRVGLHRTGGKTNAQFSQWSSSETEKPNFHVPERFGRMFFVDETVTILTPTPVKQEEWGKIKERKER
jgi:hypothetical protein